MTFTTRGGQDFPDDIKATAPNHKWRPGDIVMHTKQYNRLCDLMRVRLTGTKVQTEWNGVPVHLDNSLPESGWYLVPGATG
jgi:hypothetical protein